MKPESGAKRIACREIWGGNRFVVRRMILPGLSGWVHSKPLDEDQGGGDLHYVSVCDFNLLSRVALADVSGHGQTVSAPAETLHRLMREHRNVWDQSDLMRELNRTFQMQSMGKYATAALFSYHRVNGHLAFTNAGHLAPLWYKADEDRWTWMEEGIAPAGASLQGLPVGLIPGTEYHQTVVPLAPGDLLVLYTDGITEATNREGEEFGPERLMQFASRSRVDQPEMVGEVILAALETFRGSPANDDETLVVLRRESENAWRLWPDLGWSYLTGYAQRVFGGAGN